MIEQKVTGVHSGYVLLSKKETKRGIYLSRHCKEFGGTNPSREEEESIDEGIEEGRKRLWRD